jgi:hypothetical protein
VVIEGWAGGGRWRKVIGGGRALHRRCLTLAPRRATRASVLALAGIRGARMWSGGRCVGPQTDDGRVDWSHVGSMGVECHSTREV